MIDKNTCPITGSEETELLVSYPHCITSDSRLLEANVENRISKSSGLIYNATGARGGEKDFYTDEYDFLSESVFSEWKLYDKTGSKGIYQRIIEFIDSGIELKKTGRVLDIGCGKGLLLKYFLDAHPDWKLFAVEPSLNAGEYFSKVMPMVNLYNGSFEDSPYLEEEFDLVIASGVLEHVPNPIQFMKLFKNCLGKKGVGYIGVPNFKNNPADLFTFDHLSRFTPATVEALFKVIGSTITSRYIPEESVPMWFLIKSNDPGNINLNHLYQESQSWADRAIDYIDSMFESYSRCAAKAGEDGGKIGMYGMGAIGFIGTQYTSLALDKLTAIFDDNETIWGSKKNGIQIYDPREISKLDIKHVILSANPCYLDAIRGKIIKQCDNNIKIYGM